MYTEEKKALDTTIEKLKEEKLDKSKYKPPIDPAPTNNAPVLNYDSDIQNLSNIKNKKKTNYIFFFEITQKTLKLGEELEGLLNKILAVEYDHRGTKDRVNKYSPKRF